MWCIHIVACTLRIGYLKKLLKLKENISTGRVTRDESSPGAWDLPPEVSTVKSRMLSLTRFLVSIGRIAGMMTITLHRGLLCALLLL